MTWAEVRQTVVPANWLYVVHAALAAEVARRSKVHLKRLLAVRAVEVRYRRPRHLQVIAPQEDEKAVAEEANHVRDQHELHGAFRPQLHPLQDAASHENAYASAWYCN